MCSRPERRRCRGRACVSARSRCISRGFEDPRAARPFDYVSSATATPTAASTIQPRRPGHRLWHLHPPEDTEVPVVMIIVIHRVCLWIPRSSRPGVRRDLSRRRGPIPAMNASLPALGVSGGGHTAAVRGLPGHHLHLVDGDDRVSVRGHLPHCRRSRSCSASSRHDERRPARVLGTLHGPIGEASTGCIGFVVESPTTGIVRRFGRRRLTDCVSAGRFVSAHSRAGSIRGPSPLVYSAPILLFPAVCGAHLHRSDYRLA